MHARVLWGLVILKAAQIRSAGQPPILTGLNVTKMKHARELDDSCKMCCRRLAVSANSDVRSARQLQGIAAAITLAPFTLHMVISPLPSCRLHQGPSASMEGFSHDSMLPGNQQTHHRGKVAVVDN